MAKPPLQFLPRSSSPVCTPKLDRFQRRLQLALGRSRHRFGALGWSHFQDMGDIQGARAMETIVLVWLQIMSVTGGSAHNLHVAKG